MNLKKAREEIEALQKVRESVIEEKRAVVIECSKAIRDVHTGNVEEAKKKAGGIKEALDGLEKKLGDYPVLVERMLRVPYQEYVELMVLLSVTENHELPGLDVPPDCYILGVLDAIGEMKRSAMDLLLDDKAEEAVKLHEKMEEIYYSMQGYAFPNSLVPGLKHKQDAMKRVLESLHTILVEARIRKNV
jgi:translin